MNFKYRNPKIQVRDRQKMKERMGSEAGITDSSSRRGSFASYTGTRKVLWVEEPVKGTCVCHIKKPLFALVHRTSRKSCHRLQMVVSIPEWYGGKNIFLTGGTGFMGKVLLEKLLRSCPSIGTIYVLCRSKDGLSPEERLAKIIDLLIFDRLRVENPNSLLKLVAVKGDLTKENLGISEEVRVKLAREVSVVFNLGALIRFDMALKPAVETNLSGTLRVLQLAKTMTHLEAFVHFSTAFCHCEHKKLEETVYPSPMNPFDLMKTVNWMEEKAIDILAPKILGQHPNCYTYTKRLSESLVDEYSKYFPVAIARPSIVCPALKEPVPGWIDSLNGPMGFAVAAGKGLIRSILCCSDHRVELVPVDIVINAVIAIAWQRSFTRCQGPVPCYNISVADFISMSWGEMLKKTQSLGRRYPFESGLWYPNGTIRTNPVAHILVVFFLQTVPAYLLDLIKFLVGQKISMVKIQNKIKVGMDALKYFAMKDWSIKVERTESLLKNMSEMDKNTFYLVNVDRDVNKYIKTAILGVRQYCLKEPLSSLPMARKRLRVLYFFDSIMKMFLMVFCFWAAILWVKSVHKMLDYCVDNLEQVIRMHTFIQRTV